MEYLDRFESARNTLIKHFSDLEISSGARLFAFSVLLFTLFQIPSWSSEKLSAISNYTIHTAIFSFSLGIIWFFLAIAVIMVFMVRTAFRFAACAGVCNGLIAVEPFEVLNTSIPANICAEVHQRMISKEVKCFWIFPYHWFISGTWGNDGELSDRLDKLANLKGWLVSIIIGVFILTCFVLVFRDILFP